MSLYDAPNQQVVRADGSAPWEEGTGGAEPEPKGYDEMTKAQLLDRADELDVDVPSTATKDEIRAAIDQA